MYIIQHTSEPTKKRIIKLDNDHNLLVTYTIEQRPRSFRCDCPAGLYRGNCKHQNIYKEFIRKNKINSGWAYDDERKKWLEPLE